MAYPYQYDPYGVPTVTEDSGGRGRPINPYQFKGGIHDRTTNWVKFGHRWYSVGTGRFTQRDTLDTPLDPANANRYAFAANDPINNADPLGLFTLGDAAAAAKSTPLGLGLTAGAGCLGGMTAEVIANSVDQEDTLGTDLLGSCATGTVTGLLGFGVGKVARKVNAD